MYPMIWIAMVIAATLVTLLCGGYSIESVETLCCTSQCLLSEHQYCGLLVLLLACSVYC